MSQPLESGGQRIGALLEKGFKSYLVHHIPIRNLMHAAQPEKMKTVMMLV